MGIITTRTNRTPSPSPEPSASSSKSPRSPRRENLHEGSPSRRIHRAVNSPKGSEVHDESPPQSMRSQSHPKSTPPTIPPMEEVAKVVAVCMEFMKALGGRLPSVHDTPPSPPPKPKSHKRKWAPEGEGRVQSSRGEGSRKGEELARSEWEPRRDSCHFENSKVRNSRDFPEQSRAYPPKRSRAVRREGRRRAQPPHLS